MRKDRVAPPCGAGQSAAMMETALALVLFLLPLAYSPGPGNLFFAALGGRFGLRGALPALAGYHVATLAVTLAIGLGFAGVAALGPRLIEAIRLAGVAYVIWLALGLPRAGTVDAADSPRRAGFRDGAALLILNPKAHVIILLMFSQFLPGQGAADPALVAGIAILFTVNNLVAFVLWAQAGDMLLGRFRSGHGVRALNLGFGALLAGVALWMLGR